MFGITRREYWAFLTGNSFILLVVSMIAGASSTFLFAAGLFALDVYMYINAKTEEK